MACLYTIDNKNYTLPEFKAWLVEGGLDRLYPEGNYPWVKQEASNQDFPSVTGEYYTDYYLDALGKGNYRYQSLTGEDREQEQYNEAVKLFLHGDLTKQVKPKDLDGITLLKGLENIVPFAKAKNVSKVKDTFESVSKALLPFMGKGDTRHYLNGLAIDDIDNKLIASNGHIIAIVKKIPEGTPTDNPHYDDAARELDKQYSRTRRLKNIYNRFAIDGDKDTGSMSGKDTWIDGIYPDFTKLLDMSKQAQPFEISLDSLSGYANGLTKVGKFIEGKYIKANSPITLTNGKESIALNAGYVEHAANLLRSMGHSKATVKIANNGSGLALESQDGSVFTYIANMRDGSGKLFKAYDIKKADYANGKYSPEPELKNVKRHAEPEEAEPVVTESSIYDSSGRIGSLPKNANLRSPDKVNVFNPYEDGDYVKIGNKIWQVKNANNGWYLTDTGNWRGEHKNIKGIKDQVDLIRAIESEWKSQENNPKQTETGTALYSKTKNPASDFARYILNELNKEGDFGRFPISKSKDIKTVFSEILPIARYRGWDSTKLRHEFALKGDVQQDATFEEKALARMPFYVYENEGEIWLDVSQLKTGSGGAAIYFAAGNYAHNTNQVFIGDPDGLTPDATIRRTANMLALAIRFGTTKFMEPSIEQLNGNKEEGIAPLTWEGNDEQRVMSLIETFLKNLQTHFPEIKNARYDFDAEKFIGPDSEPLEAGVLDGIRKGGFGGMAAKARAGATTTRQGIFIQSLISLPAEERTELLQKLQRWDSSLSDRGLGNLFSKGSTTGSTIEQVKSWLPKRVKPLLDAGKLKVVQSSDKGEGIEGYVENETIYLVADNINQESLNSVLSHELYHYGLATDEKLQAAHERFKSDMQRRFDNAAKGLGSQAEKEAYARVIAADTPTKDAIEEFQAYLVSQYEQNPQSLSESLRKAIKDFIAATRVFLIRSGLDMGFIKSLTPADLAAMSRYGAKTNLSTMSGKSNGTGELAKASTKAIPETITIDGKERPTRNSNGQLIHQTEEGIRNFWDWFGESKVIDDSGRPLVVYHGSPVGGFNIFDRDSAKADAKANSRKAADDGLGFWFTPSLKIAEQHRDKDKGWGPSWAIPEGEIFSTYLKIDNPFSPSNDKRITDALSINKDKNDGVIYTDLQEYVVFESTQIKSVENNGQFNPNNPDIRYSKATDALSEFKRKAGLGPKKTLSETIQHILSQGIQGNIAAIKQRWNEVKPSIEQGLFDKFLGIKLAEKEILGDVAHSLSGYISARLSTGSSSVMHALMLYGSPTWEGGIIQKKADSKGFAEMLNPVKDDLENFTAWMVARRANRLYQEGKENNFTREEIDEGLALEQPNYQAVADDIADMSKAVLDLAQESGLIEPSARAMFESNDYIPFYRLIEGKKSGPSNKGGLTHQTSGIKMLKGGENPMSDPLGNMMQNWAHLIDASMKNDALNKTLKNLDGSRFIESVPRVEFKQALIPKEQIKKLMLESGLPKEVVNEMPDELTSGIAKLWGMQAPSDPDIVRVMRDGKSEYFRVNDAMLLTSLTAVNQAQYGGIFKPMRYMKRLLTSAVTADPTFMARNFIRDSMHSWTIAEEKGFKLGIDSIHGAVKSFKEEGGYIDMMFAGASFQGGYGNYNNPDAARETMDAALRKRGIRDLRGFKDSILDTPKKYWEMYRSVGDAIENASREAILENSKRAGDEKAKYLFEAKDLMDFSMQGSFALVRALSDMLPFFNARLVGLYRLAKAGKTKESFRMMVTKGLTISMLSLALLAINSDNDDYEALEDWDKDQYWHFFFGDQHFRIPKPFELGLIFGTVPERSARALLGPDSLGKFSERMGHGALDTLSFNPVPQLFKPFVELYANKDMFTGRPIEGMADEGKLPSARYNERTSETMRELSSMLPEFLGASPKRLEHLMSGYLGALGMYALGATDVIVRNLTGMPELPAQRVDSLPIIRGFYQAKPALHTKYSTEFYEQLRNVEQIYRTINAYKNEGKLDEAKALYDENKGKLAVRKTLTTTNKDLSKMRKEIDAIYRSDLSSDVKREKIDAIMAQSNKMLQSVVKRTHPFFN